MAKRSGDFYISKAQSAGCTVKYGKGDHVKVYSPDRSSMMTVPRNLKGNGTEHSIIKWLMGLGVALTILCVAIYGCLGYI